MKKLKEKYLKKIYDINSENKEKKQNKNFYKNQNGSITLFILLSCLFFLVVVVSVSMYLKNKETSIDEQYQSIKKSYEKNVGNEESVYIELMEQ